MRQIANKVLNICGINIEDGRIVTAGKISNLSRQIFGKIDQAEYDRLVAAYWHPDEIRKARENERLFIKMAMRLRLDQSAPLKILDIGGKGGTFAFVCRSLGHEAWTTDLESMLGRSPNPELYQLYGVPAFALSINPLTPLPFTGRKYDLITGFRTRFHSRYPWETGLEQEVHWGIAEWDYFLRDLARNHLSDAGRIFFYLGRLQERDKQGRFPPELQKYFITIHGVIDGTYLTINHLERLRSNQ